MPISPLLIDAHEEIWPLKQVFRISRASCTGAQVVAVSVSDGEHVGQGESVPLARYNQSVASVLEQIQSIKGDRNLDRQRLQNILPPGAARNALDCALWDLEAKRCGKRAWELANTAIAPEVETSFTISLDVPEKMGTAAKENAQLPILKLKLGGDDRDLARVEAVRKAAPMARLLVDANESWSAEHYQKIVSGLKMLGVELIEQPFPAKDDGALEVLEHPIPVCADESCHTTGDLPSLTSRYEAVNVKLDKTGGFTEALRLCETARDRGFKILIGCMVCTSLSIAPARLLANFADWIDLDGPLLLARDRDHPLLYVNGMIGIPSRGLWG